MENEDKQNVEFNDLVFSALDHGLNSIQDIKDPLIPFVMIVNINGDKELHRLMTERLEDGPVKARELVRESKSKIEMYAIAWDGYVTAEGKKWDAILVEGASRKAEKGWLLAQRYESAGLFKRKKRKVGNPILLEKTEKLNGLS